MSEYQPGTVAIISDGDPMSGEWRAVKDDKGWASLAPEIGWVDDASAVVVRPMVLLDLRGNDLAGSLRRVQQASHGDKTQAEPTDRNLLMDLIAEIEAQTKPPRIPEPGLWGVVSACLTDEAQVENCKGPLAGTYVRSSEGMWRHADSGYGVTWNELHDPVLVREGLS